MSNSDLFLEAFGGDNKPEGRSEGVRYSVAAREQAFLTAFGMPQDRELPKANKGVGAWRINNQKAGKLSFTEQWALGELQDTPYQDLPDWVLDSGLAVPSAEESKLQKDLNKIDGYTTSERKQAFNVFAAEIDVLAEMASREILRNSSMILDEFDRACERFGAQEVQRALSETAPEAFNHYRLMKAEQKARIDAAEQEAHATQESVRNELKAAADAIQKMGGSVPDELGKLDAQVRGTDAID